MLARDSSNSAARLGLAMNENWSGRHRAATRRLEALAQPVVAAVQADAIGGGLEVALLCDLVVADERARFGVPEVKLGLIPGGGGTAREDVLARARRTARKASDLLDGAEIHGDLRAALRGATWTCGTTSRAVAGRPALGPRALAAEASRRAPEGAAAIVFVASISTTAS